VAPAGQHDVTAPSAAWLAGGRPGITGIQVIVPAEALAPAEASVQAEVPVQAGRPAEASSGDPRA
jgi:hypothetical protein